MNMVDPTGLTAGIPYKIESILNKRQLKNNVQKAMDIISSVTGPSPILEGISQDISRVAKHKLRIGNSMIFDTAPSIDSRSAYFGASYCDEASRISQQGTSIIVQAGKKLGFADDLGSLGKKAGALGNIVTGVDIALKMANREFSQAGRLAFSTAVGFGMGKLGGYLLSSAACASEVGIPIAGLAYAAGTIAGDWAGKNIAGMVYDNVEKMVK